MKCAAAVAKNAGDSFLKESPITLTEWKTAGLEEVRFFFFHSIILFKSATTV